MLRCSYSLNLLQPLLQMKCNLTSQSLVQSQTQKIDAQNQSFYVSVRQTCINYVKLMRVEQEMCLIILKIACKKKSPKICIICVKEMFDFDFWVEIWPGSFTHLQCVWL